MILSQYRGKCKDFHIFLCHEHKLREAYIYSIPSRWVKSGCGWLWWTGIFKIQTDSSRYKTRHTLLIHNDPLRTSQTDILSNVGDTSRFARATVCSIFYCKIAFACRKLLWAEILRRVSYFHNCTLENFRVGNCLYLVV